MPYVEPVIGGAGLTPISSTEFNKLIINANLIEDRTFLSQQFAGPFTVAHNAGNVTLLTYNLTNNNVSELVLVRMTIQFSASIGNVLSLDLRKNGVSLTQIARMTSIANNCHWLEFPVLDINNTPTPATNAWSLVGFFSSGSLVTTATIHNIHVVHTQL